MVAFCPKNGRKMEDYFLGKRANLWSPDLKGIEWRLFFFPVCCKRDVDWLYLFKKCVGVVGKAQLAFLVCMLKISFVLGFSSFCF